MSTPIKEAFKKFFNTHKTSLEKEGIKLEGLDEPTPIVMVATGELEDGTKIASPADTFSEGADLFVIDAEGKEVPAPDGEHKLSDGTVITTVAGKITTVVEGAPADTEMSAEEIASNLESLGTKLSEVSAERDQLKTELEALKATSVTQSTEVTNLKAEVAKLKKSPAASSVKLGAKGEKKEDQPEKPFSEMSTVERVQYNLHKSKSN